jgi:hypothetical protein
MYNTDTAVIDASEEIDLAVNTEKTKYALMSRHQKAGKKNNTKR